MNPTAGESEQAPEPGQLQPTDVSCLRVWGALYRLGLTCPSADYGHFASPVVPGGSFPCGKVGRAVQQDSVGGVVADAVASRLRLPTVGFTGGEGVASGRSCGRVQVSRTRFADPARKWTPIPVVWGGDGSVAGPSSREAASSSRGLRDGHSGCRDAFGSNEFEPAREARLPSRQITSSSGLSVGAVSAVLGLALERGRDESSPPDLEMPQPPDAISFTRVRNEITQGGRLASQLLRSVRCEASLQATPPPVPRVVPTMEALSDHGRRAARLRSPTARRPDGQATAKPS